MDKFCSYPILRYFDVTRLALLYTDASGFSIGAILGQVGDDGKELFANISACHYENMNDIIQ